MSTIVPTQNDSQVPNIAALRNFVITGLSSGKPVFTSGYYAANDGGGGMYVYDASSTAADNGGTVIAPASGVGRWLLDFNGPVNVRWTGAKGDGVTNDTVAFARALAAEAGQGLVIPPGAYLVDQIGITRSGTKIVGLERDTTIIRPTGNGASGFGLFTDNIGTTTYKNGLVLQCFTIDMVNMADSALSHGLHLEHSFDNLISSVQVINAGVGTSGIYLGRSCYTTLVLACAADRLSMVGVSGADRVTTNHVIDFDGMQIVLTNAQAITVRGATLQGNRNKFALATVTNLLVDGGDFEGTGYVYYATGPVIDLVSVNNALDGFSGTAYKGGSGSGDFIQCDLQDEFNNSATVPDSDNGRYIRRYGTVSSGVPGAASLASLIIDTLTGWIGFGLAKPRANSGVDFAAYSATFSNTAGIRTYNAAGSASYGTVSRDASNDVRLGTPEGVIPSACKLYSANGRSVQFFHSDASAVITPAGEATNKGFLPPQFTTTQRDALTGLSAGLLIYNTSTNKLNLYNGASWEAVTSA